MTKALHLSSHRPVNIKEWNRREHFLFFRDFEEPYFGITVHVDCTQTYKAAKQAGDSFYLRYLHCILHCCNQVKALRLRMPTNNEVWLYDQVHASSTETTNQQTFSYALLPYSNSLERFVTHAQQEIAGLKDSGRLFSESLGDEPRLDVIHFSALPWLNFTGISHARHYSRLDSVPKISVGKCTAHGDRFFMPVSLHLHHALADGADAAEFFRQLEALL